MARHRYTDEQIEFLRVGYREMRIPALTVAFNQAFGTRCEETSIKAAVKNRKFKSGRGSGFAPGERPGLLTPQQHEFLVREYRQCQRKTLTALLNAEFGTSFRPSQIVAYLKNHGIKSGRTGTFKKGSRPFNKDTKGVMKPNRTSFKKGNMPPNRRPLGHERIDSKDGFIWIKVAEPNPYTSAKTRYKQKHIHVWEAHHGAVPDGHCVSFIDGDRLNCEIENLMLVTRQELLYLNRSGFFDVPADVKPTVLALAKIEVRRHELMRDNP